MIRNFLNSIKSFLVPDKGEKVEKFMFYGDGRGTTESEEAGLENVSLEVLEKYKYDCAVQFALAVKCIHIKQLMLGDVEEEIEYKQGETFRVLTSIKGFTVGDKFIVSYDQKVKRGEEIIGAIPARGIFSCRIKPTEVVRQDKAFTKSSAAILDITGAKIASTIDSDKVDSKQIDVASTIIPPDTPEDLSKETIN